jgi:large repetitive protein
VGINNSSQIVGYYYDNTDTAHGFFYDGSTYTTINDPLGWSSAARGINNTGQIVGNYIENTVAQTSHGFLYSGGTYTTIDHPLGTGGTIANGINDAGEIVGYYIDSNNFSHGFLCSNGTYTTIDDPLAIGSNGGTIAAGINNAHQIVGYYGTDNGYHGFLASMASSAPTVTAIAPTSGTASGGTSVAITGTNFTGATAVKFGGANALFTVNSATSITATSPAGTPGVVDVTVTTTAGTSATGAFDQSTYTTAPVAPVITLNPTNQTVNAGQMATFSAAAGGTPTPTVQWQQSTDGGATFTSIAGATSTAYSFVPTLSQSGYVYQAVFTNSLGSQTTAPATLTVLELWITSVSPNPVTGSNVQQLFTIKGSNFSSGATVTLRDLTLDQTFANRKPSTLSSTQLSVQVNFTAAPDSWSVEVINLDGQSTGPFKFQVLAPPVTSKKPTCELAVNPSSSSMPPVPSVPPSQQVLLSWSSTNAVQGTINNGTVFLFGNETITASKTPGRYNYNGVFTGSGGTAHCSTMVTVSAPQSANQLFTAGELPFLSKLANASYHLASFENNGVLGTGDNCSRNPSGYINNCVSETADVDYVNLTGSVQCGRSA